MGKGYLTDKELYDIEVAIYNDNNEALYKALPEGIEDENEEGIVKELAQGLEYYILPETHLMLRQDGRLLNARFIRPVKPLWTPHDYIVNDNRGTMRYTTIYDKMGWKFNHREIAERFIKNKWPMSITTGYKEKYKELYF